MKVNAFKVYIFFCLFFNLTFQFGGGGTGQQVISKFGNTVFVHASPSITGSFPNMRIHLSDVANVIFPKVSYEFRGSVCFIPDEETIILFSKTSCIMLDKSEEITPLSFDQFHEMTSLKPHVLICDKITDENSAKTFCARMPGDEFPKIFDLRKFTGKLSADFDQKHRKNIKCLLLLHH